MLLLEQRPPLYAGAGRKRCRRGCVRAETHRPGKAPRTGPRDPRGQVRVLAVPGTVVMMSPGVRDERSRAGGTSTRINSWPFRLNSRDLHARGTQTCDRHMSVTHDASQCVTAERACMGMYAGYVCVHFARACLIILKQRGIDGRSDARATPSLLAGSILAHAVVAWLKRNSACAVACRRYAPRWFKRARCSEGCKVVQI